MTDKNEQSEKVTVTQLLASSDKADFVDWVRENIQDAEKAIVIFASPADDGGLDLIGRQLGFAYHYEMMGFAQWMTRFIDSSWSVEDEEGQ